MARIVDDPKIYEKLCKRFPLKPIRTDKENDLAAAVCDELLTNLSNLSRSEKDYLEVLTDLIAKYESKWDSEISDFEPREMVKFLMESNSLTQTDLIPIFGSSSRISEFLSGARPNLSLNQIQGLAKRFNLSTDVFIGKTKSAL
ncbi:MAG: hypothetical protein K2W82_04645 [Candidatus Obscuribacterales bacterium]|nr:hypothetical protein [Candidatus Obscuribacterales bacterium]